MGTRARSLRLFGAALALVAAGATPSAGAVDLAPLGPELVPPTVPAPAGERRVAAAQAGDALVGVFAVDAGSCSGSGPAKGSTFRMIQPGGNPSGPFLANSDSPCDDQTFTPLQPGADGGLSTAAFQANPARAFDANGNGTATAIVKPQKFMGVAFAVSTNEKDPQTGTAVAKPSLSSAGGKLSGDLRAVSVAYNNQHFNQGSPKPDGSRPGLTAGPTGTYDPDTKKFTLDWTSTIVGGPFNGFAGKWHLEGTFRPSASAPAAAATPEADAETPAAAPASAGGAAPASGTGSATAAAPVPSGVSHPNTGPPFRGEVALAFVALGAALLLLVRRSTTAACGAPAGGRARRP